jgi:GxxExxY protein
VQVLAVSPGKSGQKFDKRVLEKIRFLKKNYPDVIIEVDGGINLETAKLCKEAGAGILVAGNYIWGSKNPQGAYEELQIATDKGRMATDRGAGSKAGLLYKELTYRLRGIFYSVRNKYGKHHKEKIYQNALKEELDNASINYLTEPRLDIVSVSSGRKIGTYVPDFLIDDKIIIELKASPFTTKDMEMQLIEYLKTSRYELAFLVNFGEFSFKPRRYIHTSDRKFIANQ